METKKNKGGRPLGAANRLAIEARERAQATGELPHEFLLRIARGEPIFRKVVALDGNTKEVQEEYSFEDRKDAAKAAAPYFAPKISTVEVIRGVADDELDSIIAKLATETGLSAGLSGETEEDEGQASPTPRRRAKLDSDL